MDELNSRRASAPVMPMTEVPLHPYRSLRGEKRTTITKIPDVAAIPEVEGERVEERLEKPKITSRPSSSNSLRKEKIDINERTIHYNKSDKDLHFTPHINQGFLGSNLHIHRSTSTLHSSPVVREQYCSCFRNWTKRERILLLVIGCLLGIVCGLFVAVGVLIERQDGNHTNSMWFALRL